MIAITATPAAVRPSTFSALLTGLRRLTGRASGSKPARSRRQAPRVEALEGRTVLSAFTSVPPASMSFSSTPNYQLLGTSRVRVFNGTVTGSEIHRIAFTARSTGVYILAAITPNSSLDPVLGVYNNQGKRIAYKDDLSPTNHDSATAVRLTAGQTVFLAVSSYKGQSTGKFNYVVVRVATTPTIAPTVLPTVTQSLASIKHSQSQSAYIDRLSAEQGVLNIGGNHVGPLG